MQKFAKSRRSKGLTGVWRGLLFVAVGLLLASCQDNQEILEEYAASPIGVAARQEVELLRHGDIDTLLQHFDPAIQATISASALKGETAFLFPKSEPEQIELIGFHCMDDITHRPSNVPPIGGCSYKLEFQYSYPSRWVLVEVAFRMRQSVTTVTGLFLGPLRQPLEHDPVASFKHISAFGFCALVLATLNFVLTVLTLIWTWRRPLPKWPWAWRISMLFGIGCWTVNCQENTWAWSTLSASLPAVGVGLGSYEPVAVALYIPVFALAYWARYGIRRRRVQERQWLEDQDIADKFS